MSKIIGVLAGVGALNWLLVAFGFNLVEVVFRVDLLINIVYVAVGLAGLVVIVKTLGSSCGDCGSCKTKEKVEEAPTMESPMSEDERM